MGIFRSLILCNQCMTAVSMRSWSLVVLLLCFSAVGCSTMHLPDYAPGSVDAYKNTQTNGLITVAVEPMTDHAKVEEYFGTDLLAKGILPVLVVAENHSPSLSYMVSEKEIVLGTLTRQGDPAVSGEAGNTMFAGAFFVPIIAAPALIVGGAKMISDSAEVKRNFSGKALHATTLSPHERTHGFVYFALPRESDQQSNLSMQVKVFELGSSTVHTFIFPLRLSGI